ncbi:MAG: RpiB/LacA/LacB family sugar-phosphate isomerase [Candidatus Magasanikbacteria bacterium]|nr:RpiB/LacA/LacB family sugar-phosphate isomerase [Candidatus Magasanikbacteria bacterium]
MEKIYLATDHAGFELKEKIKQFLIERNFEIEDKGAVEHNEKDDYPDFISLVAKEISQNPNKKAIIFGGSGQGEAMAANRFPNVRAVVFYGGNLEIIKLSREHNDANILSIGARFLNEEEAKTAIELWLNTEFTNEERHIRRIEKIV